MYQWKLCREVHGEIADLLKLYLEVELFIYCLMDSVSFLRHMPTVSICVPAFQGFKYQRYVS